MWDWSSDVCFSDLAVTQDAYVQRRLSTMLRQSKAARLADRTQISLPVLIRLSGDIAAPDPAIERVTRIVVEFQSIGGACVPAITDRKSDGEGKQWYVCVILGGARYHKKKKN